MSGCIGYPFDLRPKIGGGNTLSTFVWGKLRTTLDPSINTIATILLLSTIGMSVLALRGTILAQSRRVEAGISNRSIDMGATKTR